MPGGIIVIANERSGSEIDRETTRRLRESLDAHGLPATVAVAQSGEEIASVARKGLEKEPAMIVAAGGDGTVSLIASIVAGSGVPLGVLPLGTLNHFAKDLNIPLDLDEAVGVIAEGAVAQVDIGEVNGRIFINNSSIGLYPKIVGHREQQQRLGRNKWLALIWSAMTMLGRYPRLRVSVAVDGREKITTTPLVFIGNNEYAIHGFEIGTRSRLDRGELSLYLPHRVGRLGLVWLAVRALFGRLRDAESFDATCASEIRIDTSAPRIRVALDGEVTTMDTPLHYTIRPAALSVVVPLEKNEEHAKEEEMNIEGEETKVERISTEE